jgi:arginine decarboxylase
MASRNLAGSVSAEVATLADEFIWILDDTASFVSGRVQASVDRYIANLLPPYAAALARYDREREYSWAAPGHQGGVAFLKSPVGRVFFDFFGENLFRTDMGIERGALGSMLGHSGPVGESERFAARVFGAHRSYTVTNGTSASNRAIMSANVGDNEIALCDRNCHKSIEQGLVNTGGIPVFLMPTRNRYGIIGPIPPEQLEPKAIAKCIADNPLARASGHKRAVYSVLTNCTYDGMCYDAADAEARLAKSVDRIHFDEAWYGYARFNPMSRPPRHAWRSGDSPEGWPDGFCEHSTHKPLTACHKPLSFTSATVVAPSIMTLQRGVLHTGEYLAAYALIAGTTSRRDQDGPPAGAHAGNHRRGRCMPPCGRACSAGISCEKGLVLCAVECGDGARSKERQAHPVSRRSRGKARNRSDLLDLAPRR